MLACDNRHANSNNILYFDITVHVKMIMIFFADSREPLQTYEWTFTVHFKAIIVQKLPTFNVIERLPENCKKCFCKSLWWSSCELFVYYCNFQNWPETWLFISLFVGSFTHKYIKYFIRIGTISIAILTWKLITDSMVSKRVLLEQSTNVKPCNN